MAEFQINKSEQPKQKKNFTVPKPGIQTKPTIIIGQILNGVAKKTFIQTGEEVSDEPIGTSKIFNVPIYCDITFNAGSYLNQDGLEINYQSLNLENVLVTIGNTKNIIKTKMQGRNGDIKEYISDGDFVIKIEGKIYGKGMNNYPIEEVQKLLSICFAPQSINITSGFLKMANIEDIVIESYNIDQMEGVRNYQPFTLNCLSDYPLILLKNA